jgi:hypothetical protein
LPITEETGERMFAALKTLCDTAQESYLAFQDAKPDEAILKEFRLLTGNILGRAFDPFLASLMKKFSALTVERLRERIPLAASISAKGLMHSVLLQGETFLAEFSGHARVAEREGLFRHGALENLAKEIERYKLFFEFAERRNII